MKSTRKLPVGGDSILASARSDVKHRQLKIDISQNAGRDALESLSSSRNVVKHSCPEIGFSRNVVKYSCSDIAGPENMRPGSV